MVKDVGENARIRFAAPTKFRSLFIDNVGDRRRVIDVVFSLVGTLQRKYLAVGFQEVPQRFHCPLAEGRKPTHPRKIVFRTYMTVNLSRSPDVLEPVSLPLSELPRRRGNEVIVGNRSG